MTVAYMKFVRTMSVDIKDVEEGGIAKQIKYVIMI